MSIRRVAIATLACALLALTLGNGSPPTPPPRVAVAASAPAAEPYADWVGSVDEAEAFLMAFPGGDVVPVILADPVVGAQKHAAAYVLWAAPQAIFVSANWLDSLTGPDGRYLLWSVMLHEYTHVIAMTSLTNGGSLPEELKLGEADRSWAGGAMLGHAAGDVGPSLEAIASCVQVAAYRAGEVGKSPFLTLTALALPRWLAGGQGAYLSDPRGCPDSYTQASFRYLEDVGGIDLRPYRP